MRVGVGTGVAVGAAAAVAAMAAATVASMSESGYGVAVGRRLGHGSLHARLNVGGWFRRGRCARGDGGGEERGKY